MTVVVLGSVRSCTVTTTATGLAMVWPGDGRRVLIEADPAGGTLAAAGSLAAEPGLVSLATAARRQLEPALVFEHAQTLPDGTAVVCAPPGGEQARSALSMLGPLFDRLAELDGLVLVDCGRLDPAGPNTRLFERAELSVLVCRPRLADLNAVAGFVQARRPEALGPLVVLAGSGPYPAGEIVETLGVEVAGHVPWDPDAAATLATVPASARQLTRSRLVRALRSLADDLASRLDSSPTDRPETASQTASEASQVVEVAR